MLSESKAQVLGSGRRGTWCVEICKRAGIGEENSLGRGKHGEGAP